MLSKTAPLPSQINPLLSSLKEASTTKNRQCTAQSFGFPLSSNQFQESLIILGLACRSLMIQLCMVAVFWLKKLYRNLPG